ncbi:MAG: hypothetical protein CMO34_02360 [Verrucomicrobia bacterium]|nr:hypothetical protein [Verrucomicrobiota bacterium]
MEAKPKHKQHLKEKALKESALVLYNDDVNTFDHVIDCLIAICDHSPEQAEQCAYLVHYKGQCTVKNGSFEALKPMKTALLEQQLSVVIK